MEYDIEQDVPFKISPDWEGRLNFTWPSGNITMLSIEYEDESRFKCQSRIDDNWGIEAFNDLFVYGN